MKNLLSQDPMRSITVFALLTAAALVLPMFSAAQSAGYDLLQTGAGSSVDLSSVGLGNVPLQGVAIQTSTGSADTIMHRKQAVPQGGGSVPLEVTALFMKSTSSVTFNGQSVDVYVTINNSGGAISTSVLPQPDALSASTGTMTVRTDGTFDSSFTVNADVIFVKAGTSVTNAANYVAHQPASAITLSSSNSSWSSTPPAGYPSSTTFPPGGIYPQPVHNNAHKVVPATCNTGLQPTQPQPGLASTRAGGKQAGGPTGAALVKACITAQ